MKLGQPACVPSFDDGSVQERLELSNLQLPRGNRRIPADTGSSGASFQFFFMSCLRSILTYRKSGWVFLLADERENWLRSSEKPSTLFGHSGIQPKHG